MTTITPVCPGQVPVGRQIGALAYDNSSGTPTLWCATYDVDPAIIFQVDVATGDVLQTINTLPSHPEDPFPALVDGLAYDQRDASLYYSTDLGFEVFNIAAAGGAGCTGMPAVQNADKGYFLEEGDMSGHALDGW